MLQPNGATDAHTVEEFEVAVLAMSAAERNRLSAVARSLHGSTGMEADDLIQEAYTRALEGDRAWSRDIDVVKFLIGAMESIADSSRKSMKVRQFSVVTAGEFSPADTEGIATRTGVLFATRNATPSAEEEAVRSEETLADAARLVAWRNKLLAAFDDDEQGQLLVMGMMDGLRGALLREATDLTEEEFPTKYKKVQRRIVALQATRRKP
jgi:DNA-directed RNA polymerase specialized sigma24 family protein